MSGLNGPHTQATGLNFTNSQLDSQPNYSFADFTQDGNGYADFPEFTGLTQVRINSPMHCYTSQVFAEKRLYGQLVTCDDIESLLS